jgi:hypothetical protein
MLLFYFLTCMQKIKSMFQIKVAKFLIRPEIGGSTLVPLYNPVLLDGLAKTHDFTLGPSTQALI